jgi:hypothetical protein
MAWADEGWNGWTGFYDTYESIRVRLVLRASKVEGSWGYTVSRLSPQASLPWKHRETVVGIQNIALVSGSGHVVRMLPG